MKSIILAAATIALSTQVFATTTSTTTEEVKKKEPLVKLNFLSEIYGGAAGINRNNRDSVSSYNYVGFTTKLNKTESLQFRAVFETGQSSVKDVPDVAGSFKNQGKAELKQSDISSSDKTLKNTQEFSIGDSVIRYNNSKARFLGENGRAQVRLYVPTSEFSGKLGKYSLRMYGGFKLGEFAGMKWSSYVIPNFRFYTVEGAGQNGLDLLNTLDGSYKINDTFSVSTSLYYRPLWYNTGQRRRDGGENIDGADLPDTFSSQAGLVELGYFIVNLSTSVSENLSIDVYAEHSRNLAATDPFVLFNENETSYGLVLSAGL